MKASSFRLAMAWTVLALSGAAAIVCAQTPLDAPPDLTREIDFERKGEYFLGPTGAKGWMFVSKSFMTDQARQIFITSVEPNSPADGVLAVGDVILGVGGERFGSDARVCLGLAIDKAETEKNKGVLKLTRWRPVEGAKARRGRIETVALRLKVMGSYSDTAPYDCPKSRRILADALKVLVEREDWGQFGVKALAFLATGEKKYVERVREFLHEAKWARPDIHVSVESGGLVCWSVGYHNLVLTEYYLATGDEYVLPAIREYAVKTAMGQSGAGTWGHGFAWTSKNGGKLHGRCVGYGALNQAGLPCFISLILAKKCGVEHPEIDAAIARSTRFFSRFIGHGSVGYGFHRPSLEVYCNGRNGMSGNGKNGIAAVAFRLLGRPEGTRFFARMAASLYKTCEYGHSGNCYSYFWDPLGAHCAGPRMVAAFHKEMRWYYALTRMADGRFVNQPLGGHYGRCVLDPTIAQVLTACLPRRAIHLTGKGQDRKHGLDAKAAAQTIAAGRWRFADTGGMSADELIDALDCWSPIGREWIAKALAEKEGDFIARLTAMARSGSPEARAGACAALGHQGQRAAAAVGVLSKAIDDPEPVVSIAAGYALARLEKAARPAVPTMLRAIADSNEPGPMRPRQQALAYSVGYPGGRYAPLYFQGLLPTLAADGDPIQGVNRELLYAYVRKIARDPSARVRGCGVYVFRHFTRRDLAEMAQVVYDCSRELPGNYAMFGDMPRNYGMELLARFRVAEGLAVCMQTFELDRWGLSVRFGNRLRVLQAYGAAAKPYLPQLREMRSRFKAGEQRELLEQTLAAVEKDNGSAETVELAALVDEELLAGRLAHAKNRAERVKICRGLIAAHPERSFLRTACLRRLEALGEGTDPAAALPKEAGVRGGLIVCIGERALDRVSGDWSKPGRTFHCLETSDARVAAVRGRIAAAGCHGKVSAAKFDGKHLPYINNLVSRLVVASKRCAVPSDEIRRALAPYGTAVAPRGASCLPRPARDVGEGYAAFTKPYPGEMDEWPQRLHGADNNCVARDTVVGPPRHVQWVSGPGWLRAHIGSPTVTSMVSSGGRLFSIEDHETAENPLLPARWSLVARDAFNGMILWMLDYPRWEQVTAHMSAYHAQMQKRLVAVGQTVYCTPGLTAPIAALDAASGKVLRAYKGTAGTQEFVYHDGRLYAVVGDRMHYFGYKQNGPLTVGRRRGKAGIGGDTPPDHAGPKTPAAVMAFEGDGFPPSSYNPQTPNVENPTCVIVAVEAATGKTLWRSGKIVRYTGCSMGLKKGRLVYQSTQGVFCLDAETGGQVWAARKKIPYGTGERPHTVVLSDDAVYSEEGRRVHAYSLADGRDYWGKAIPARKGCSAPTDLLLAAGALWMCGSCNDPKGVVRSRPTAYDLRTGEPIRTLPQKLSKPMGHDRCYRNFITERFFINSKTGGPDCMDFRTDAEYPAAFTRATCSVGPLPCNGLIYCGPWSCQCHIPTGLNNFNAFHTNEDSLPTRGQVVKVERSARLEKGVAYGKAAKAGKAPWPTYRQDARRYAGTNQPVPAKGLKALWQASLGQALSAPTIADGKVFVAETETYTLRALDAGSGKTLWSYLAGGRIDSPPTYHEGFVLFGSRDGWVHCLRASDGALSWRWRDLPERLLCAFGRLESAWPVHGSVLVQNGTAYFCAGRSSYLDGGIFVYGLDPVTGNLRYQRRLYGPYGEDGFPRFVEEGSRSETEVILGNVADVMSGEAGTVYLRQQAFQPDLTDAAPGKHLLASSGMLESRRNHREYKLVKENFNHRKMWTTLKTPYPTGDIIVSDGTDYYSVFGHPVHRGKSWNPRGGYALLAKTRTGDGWTDKWQATIPMTGKAMVLAGETVFVAGAPLVFRPDDLGGTYAGRRGAILHAVSAVDGTTLAEYTLDKLPVWDGIAAAYGRVFIVNQDGTVDCWGE